MWCVRVCASATFVLIGAASTHVVEDGEVGGRDGVGTATAVAMVTAQAAPWGSLCVDAAGAAAALRGDGRGSAVPIWDILRLSWKHKWGHNNNDELKGLNPRPEVTFEPLKPLNGNYSSEGHLTGQTHNDGLFLLRGVLDGDAFDLLVEALHAVAETRGRWLGYRDGDQDGFGHRRLYDTNTHTQMKLIQILHLIFTFIYRVRTGIWHLHLMLFKTYKGYSMLYVTSCRGRFHLGMIIRGN